MEETDTFPNCGNAGCMHHDEDVSQNCTNFVKVTGCKLFAEERIEEEIEEEEVVKDTKRKIYF